MAVLLRIVLILSSITTSVYAGKGCSNAQADAVRNIRFRIQYSPSTMDSSVMSGWGGGGGPRRKIPSYAGMNNTFAEREYGGGDRKTIYGTREYGSGYPYGADGANPSSSIAGRPFPYGMWPISWGPSYLGGAEFYGSNLDMIRPGGTLGVVKVGTRDITKWPGVGEGEVYEMIGDKESLAFMMADLVDWCHATPQWPRSFNPLSTATTGDDKMPRPENVIQYYRASSFALAYDGYNSSATSTGPSYSYAHTNPLPSPIATSSFLQCVNDTIGVALPIVDAPPDEGSGLSDGAIAGIIIGSIAFFVAMMFFLSSVWKRYQEKREQKRLAEEDPEPIKYPAEAREEALQRGREEAMKQDESQENTVYQ